MKRSTIVLVTGMFCILGVAVWASHTGYGVPKPMKEPVSVREGSVRRGAVRSGRTRTHYFIGGGIHGGK